MSIYNEIIQSSLDDFYKEECYSIPLSLSDLLKVYNLINQEDHTISDKISSFLSEKYDLNLQHLHSIYYDSSF